VSETIRELRQRAVKLLARREHTRSELARKLAAHGTPEEIDTVLNQLATVGLQSDSRFTESYLRSQAARLGAARLRQTLRTKGVEMAVIDAQVVDLPDELGRARVIWQKKFSTPPADSKEWARQARFLQGRGFSVEIIRTLMNECEE
jgi:regulatory protein